VSHGQSLSICFAIIMAGVNVAIGLGGVSRAIRESAPLAAPVPCAAPSRGPVGVLPEGS
jgi:hypothetical protein